MDFVVYTDEIQASIKNMDTDNVQNDWPIKDLSIDTLPGTSLGRACNELLSERKGDTVIVALIDMPVESSHPELSSHMWLNTDEIPDNLIDDDHNGYIDDTRGWNFLGNAQGENYVFMNYAYTRLLKKYNYHLADIDSRHPNFKNDNEFAIYKNAIDVYKKRHQYATRRLRFLDSLSAKYWEQKQTLLRAFKRDTFFLEELDVLAKNNSNNKKLLTSIEQFKKHLSRGVNDNWINNTLLQAEKRLEVMLGLDYNDRIVPNDNAANIEDHGYGNNKIDHNTGILKHGTQMAGIITSPFGNAGLGNIIKKIKLMPICVSGLGDENDKDMALAIRYAVDNGADVINISSGKYFSVNEEWVKEAMLYAEKHNVLIVSSSGNEGIKLDGVINKKYPNDIDSKGKEISENFIRVGSSGYALDSTFVHPATNWGMEEVDIFAPGEKIYTTMVGQGYTTIYGTSAAAAMVSKIAAIVLSFYPNIPVSDLKEIILRSGVKFDIEVPKDIKTTKDTLVPFSKLSKTGSVVNAYNAVLLAEQKYGQK